MEPGVAPEWVQQLFPWMIWGAVIVGLIWLVLLTLDYLNRRAYNLTMADRGGSGGDPGFLKVDKDKRDAAIAAGEDFDKKIEARDAAERAPTPSAAAQYLPIAKVVTAVFALLTMVTAVLGSVGRIEYYDEAVRRLSSWERFSEIVSNYWLGFVVVLLLIAIQVYQFVLQLRSE
ncbi:MAG: hypothetical protein AAGF51_04595 [Pseudomonadota bacterium]